MRHICMVWAGVLCALVSGLAASAPSELQPLLRNIEERYNHAQSLRLEFSETYSAMRRPAQSESGLLYLSKPGRMRWEYREPAGKVFLSDGKDVILYLPDERRAEKSKLKESEDMRAPLAFLLGKMNFAKEFQSIRLRREGAQNWVVAEPKSRDLAYTQVEFQATPAGEIRRVRITGQDQSRLEFEFSGERLNAAVDLALFTFRPPAGVQIVQAER